MGYENEQVISVQWPLFLRSRRRMQRNSTDTSAMWQAVYLLLVMERCCMACSRSKKLKTHPVSYAFWASCQSSSLEPQIDGAPLLIPLSLPIYYADAMTSLENELDQYVLGMSC
jgi:hypothetical protein